VFAGSHAKAATHWKGVSYVRPDDLSINYLSSARTRMFLVALVNSSVTKNAEIMLTR
jgi:hypothetical protein